MNIDTYMSQAMKTAMYPRIVEGEGSGLIYPALKLNGEAGEVAEVVGKYFRDGMPFENMRARLIDELGDVYWYLAALCFELQVLPSTVLQKNLTKLFDRQRRGVIQGSGDDR